MSNTIETEILISGGGAVGLFLGLRLQQLGFDTLIIERNIERSTHSRSIGIHPPSLEYLEKMGIVDSFIEQGLHVHKGLAIGDDGILGELDFSSCPPPYPFVLTLPQYQTEILLEGYLEQHYPGSLKKGSKLIAFMDSESGIKVEIQNYDDTESEINAQYLIGCDGKNSTVRKQLKINFNGGSYPDTFIMGDFEDTTNFETAAAIYLQSKGLIESFPLPDNKRRWVIRTPEYISSPSPEHLISNIESRTDFTIPLETNSMISSFGVQHYLVDSFGRDRTGIIGDAAHIVSPFGGQGMNLGWMDAWELSNTLLSQKKSKSGNFPWKSFSVKRRMAAWQAIKRAEFNMSMGREHHYQAVNEMFIKSLLHLPTKWILPRLFTMRWL